MPVLKFLLALILGSTLAAVITLATASPKNATPLIVIGVAATFAIFGLIPAASLGMPALKVFQRLNVAHPLAVLMLTAGGAAVGALLMTVTFTGFERWGAIAGASIGLLQGLLLYNKKIARTDSVAP